MNVCHHSNSRQISCGCGATNLWWSVGNNKLVCPFCRRIHRRGPDGPAMHGKPCEGTGETFTTEDVVREAKAAFESTLASCGIYPHKEVELEMSTEVGGGLESYSILYSGTFISQSLSIPAQVPDEPTAGVAEAAAGQNVAGVSVPDDSDRTDSVAPAG